MARAQGAVNGGAKVRASLPAVCVAAALAVCHGQNAWAATPNPKIWNASEIAEALRLEVAPRGSRQFTTDEGVVCGVATLLTTSGAVRLYTSAGDVVATNPSKTAGAKIVAPEARDCLKAAERRLKLLD